MSSADLGDLVEVIVVPRETYRPTLACVTQLIDSLPPSVRLTVVRGGMPTRLVRSLGRHGSRLRIVGPSRHLAPNAARAIGLQAATAAYVVFIDNDVHTQPGWLEPLVELARNTGAAAVRPVIAQSLNGEVTVHEAGGQCHLDHDGDTVTLVENHHLSRAPLRDLAGLTPQPVEMFEFHCVLFHRATLVAVGGPDERMKSLGDHLDLALRIHAAGGSVWLCPASMVTYAIPTRVAWRDLAFFLGRWSPSWNRDSHAAFAERHGPVTFDSYTWRYGDVHRTYAWRRWMRPIARIAAPVIGRDVTIGLSRLFDRWVGAHLARAALRLAPRWRGGGLVGTG